jgi:hypothetical protein
MTFLADMMSWLRLSESQKFWNNNFHRRLTKSCHLLFLNQFLLVPNSFVFFLFKICVLYISVQYVTHNSSLLLHLPNEFFYAFIISPNCASCPSYCVETWAGQFTSPHSTHYRHTRHMLPHNHDGVITFFKYFNNF